MPTDPYKPINSYLQQVAKTRVGQLQENLRRQYEQQAAQVQSQMDERLAQIQLKLGMAAMLHQTENEMSDIEGKDAPEQVPFAELFPAGGPISEQRMNMKNPLEGINPLQSVQQLLQMAGQSPANLGAAGAGLRLAGPNVTTRERETSTQYARSENSFGTKFIPLTETRERERTEPNVVTQQDLLMARREALQQQLIAAREAAQQQANLRTQAYIAQLKDAQDTQAFTPQLRGEFQKAHPESPSAFDAVKTLDEARALHESLNARQVRIESRARLDDADERKDIGEIARQDRVITGVVNRFEKSVSPLRERLNDIDSARNLIEGALAGGKIEPEALKRALAKISGEKGVLTARDVGDFAGAQDWASRFNRFMERGIKGTLPPSDLAAMSSMLEQFDGGIKQGLERAARREAKRMSELRSAKNGQPFIDGQGAMDILLPGTKFEESKEEPPPKDDMPADEKRSPVVANQGATVKMIGPNGEVGWVPEDKVEEFKRKGARIAQ